MGSSPWGCKESDTTEQLHFLHKRHCSPPSVFLFIRVCSAMWWALHSPLESTLSQDSLWGRNVDIQMHFLHKGINHTVLDHGSSREPL